MTRAPLDTALTDEFETLREERASIANYRHENSVATRKAVKRAAEKARWPKTRIAEVSGLSRQTVHDILRD